MSAVFTNRVEDMRLQDLAEMDVREMVQQVLGHGGGGTASAGIAYTKPHFPFSSGYRHAEELIAAADSEELILQGVDCVDVIAGPVRGCRAVDVGFRPAAGYRRAHRMRGLGI